MRIRFSPGAIIETVVALVTALFLTFAGFEMLAGTESLRHFATTLARTATTQGDADGVAERLAMPHVDSSQV